MLGALLFKLDVDPRIDEPREGQLLRLIQLHGHEQQRDEGDAHGAMDPVVAGDQDAGQRQAEEEQRHFRRGRHRA